MNGYRRIRVKYFHTLASPTERGLIHRRWHDRVFRFSVLVKSLFVGTLRKNWDVVRYPNPAQYI